MTIIPFLFSKQKRQHYRQRQQQQSSSLNRLLVLLLIIDLAIGSHHLRSLSSSNDSNNNTFSNDDASLFHQIIIPPAARSTNQKYTNDTIVPSTRGSFIGVSPPTTNNHQHSSSSSGDDNESSSSAYTFPAIAKIVIPHHVSSLPRTISRFDVMGEHVTKKTKERTITIIINDAHHFSTLRRQEDYRVIIDVAETKRLTRAEQRQHTKTTTTTTTTPLSQQPPIDYLKASSSTLSSSSSSSSQQRDDAFTRISFRKCMRDLSGTYETIYSFLRQHQNLTRAYKIGESYLKTQNDSEGHDIIALQISNFDSPIANKAIFFVMTGLHPRELAPVELALRFAAELVEGYGVDNADATQILDHVEIHFLFQANPDGREAVEAMPLAWSPRRKNMNFENMGGKGFRRCQAESGSYYQPGVDLNRNFPFEYGRKDGASDKGCEPDYHGVGPGSEPEVRAIMDYTRYVFPKGQQRWYEDMRDVPHDDYEYNDDDDDASSSSSSSQKTTGIFLDIHSYGELILWPYVYANQTTPHHRSFSILADKFQRLTKYTFAGGGQYDFIYQASGTSLDWAYTNLRCASFTMEIGREFFERCGVFEKKVVPGNMKVLYYAAKVARRPYEISKGPDVEEIYVGYPEREKKEKVARRSESLYVETTVHARRRKGNVFRETKLKGVIQEVRLFVDEHPYDDSNNIPGFLLMTPLDGTFDSVSEGAYYDLPMMAYAPGKHILHIVARDSDGYEGPISSMFFHVVD